VKMRVGKISMARLIGNDIMLFSTGQIVDVPDVDRGCRTKSPLRSPTRRSSSTTVLRAAPLVFYGDHSQDLLRFSG